MSIKRENLIKLLKLVDEISDQPENAWFLKQLKDRVFLKNPSQLHFPQIEEIYEYCIKRVIREHAERFYAEFKLQSIKARLVDDFIRMEKFRREDSFEDFCLAAYQQLEAIIMELIKPQNFIDYLRENKGIPAILRFDNDKREYVRKGNPTIGSLIFFTTDQSKIDRQISAPIQEWSFNEKYRSVLYYYYFNKDVRTNTNEFDRTYNMGYELYQARNLNHRGSNKTPYQQSAIDKLIPNQHKYYFKFLGFVEDFVTMTNTNIDRGYFGYV